MGSGVSRNGRYNYRRESLVSVAMPPDTPRERVAQTVRPQNAGGEIVCRSLHTQSDGDQSHSNDYGPVPDSLRRRHCPDCDSKTDVQLVSASRNGGSVAHLHRALYVSS